MGENIVSVGGKGPARGQQGGNRWGPRREQGGSKEGTREWQLKRSWEGWGGVGGELEGL